MFNVHERYNRHAVLLDILKVGFVFINLIKFKKKKIVKMDFNVWRVVPVVCACVLHRPFSHTHIHTYRPFSNTHAYTHTHIHTRTHRHTHTTYYNTNLRNSIACAIRLYVYDIMVSCKRHASARGGSRVNNRTYAVANVAAAACFRCGHPLISAAAVTHLPATFSGTTTTTTACD